MQVEERARPLITVWLPSPIVASAIHMIAVDYKHYLGPVLLKRERHTHRVQFKRHEILGVVIPADWDITCL